MSFESRVMRISSFFLRARGVCLLALLPASLLFAQFESGTVLGSVHDPSGAAVPNATVTLQDVGAGINYKTRTDGNGNYEFVNERRGRTGCGWRRLVSRPLRLKVSRCRSMRVNESI